MKPPLPADLIEIIGDARWQDNTEGFSGAQVFVLEVLGKPNRYLKVMTHGQELQAEKLRLDWLRGRIPVPEVIYFGEDSRGQYLLISEITGWMAFDEAFSDKLPSLVRLIAKGLRDIHSIPIHDCPFDQRLSLRVKTARRRVRDGLVDVNLFEAKRRDRTAPSLYEELLRTRPDVEDVVFTHGDYCLPNIIVDPDRRMISGFIDWGRAGIADRYQDLALAARSLVRNFGPQWVSPLFQEYGIGQIDEKKLEFYQLLDEFF